MHCDDFAMYIRFKREGYLEIASHPDEMCVAYAHKCRGSRCQLCKYDIALDTERVYFGGGGSCSCIHSWIHRVMQLMWFRMIFFIDFLENKPVFCSDEP